MSDDDKICPYCGHEMDEEDYNFLRLREASKLSDAFFNWPEAENWAELKTMEPSEGLPNLVKLAKRWLASPQADQYKWLGWTPERLAADVMARI